MADINLHMNTQVSFTRVSNAFIDHYMKDANGEYVKIYLYLLRALSEEGQDFSIAGMADALGQTQLDIRRALTYWQERGLLSLQCDMSGEICDICLYDAASARGAHNCGATSMDQYVASTVSDASSVTPLPVKQETYPAAKQQQEAYPVISAQISLPTPVETDYSASEMDSLGDNDDVKEILFVAQRYVGRALSHSDVNHLLYWYDGLSMSVDLIEHLIAHCVDLGKTSFSYMNKIAIGWATDGVTTVEDAILRANEHSRETKLVMKSLGISGRTLTEPELQFVSRWFHDWNFSEDMVREACKRTIMATGRPQMAYTDRILSDWNSKGITTLAQLPEADMARRKAYQPTPKRKAPAAATKFHNYTETEYDVAALESQILKRSFR